MIIRQLSLFPYWSEQDTYMGSTNNTKNNSLKQKYHNFGIEFCARANFSGKYGIPFISSYKGEIPQRYITFGEISKTGNVSACVTFFNYDYILEHFGDMPDKYLQILSKYKCVAEPDFSLKVNTPLSVQIANTYRNNALAYKMQEFGIPVIPSMSWSNSQSYDFASTGTKRAVPLLSLQLEYIKTKEVICISKMGSMRC